ncbi:MAG: NAD(P)-dependent oxidoreductase [Acidocella sp. 20-57-95]|nr:MAG: NAD(P)-dependent oxidoreductase [Acidocella sp. 20-57-95]OYV58691.1 MAG: NAD(P)-dependent oxidoreductase [Acidocella sp. 21-58-7]HQT64704.1 SDR family oxidoreductase [Acidocella sp.]HQU05224.1 SDR family oxidoreductase [Acidocella sp.]
MKLLVFGFGYSGRAVAKAAYAAGFAVTATSRQPALQKPEIGTEIIAFTKAGGAIADATHILATAAPDAAGDPVLLRYGAQIAAAKNLRWAGYLSTTGIYGNRDGDWVDEDTIPAPQSPRAERRVAAETAWAKFPNIAVDIFRLAGIYGPGRSMFDDLREGMARCVVKPGHLFGRIHRDDIAHGVVAAMRRNANPGVNIFNFSDDEPAASADVVVEAARILGVAPPAPVAFTDAYASMSEMARSFWAENRKVGNAKTKAALGIHWKYPTYREGLRAILVEERGEASL